MFLIFLWVFQFFFFVFFKSLSGNKNSLSDRFLLTYSSFYIENNAWLLPNFFKKNRGLKSFFKKGKASGVSSIFQWTTFSFEKAPFFFFNVLCDFIDTLGFSGHFFVSFGDNISDRYLLVIFSHLLETARATVSFFPRILFLDFKKFSDFFFSQSILFTSLKNSLYSLSNFFDVPAAIFSAEIVEPSLTSKIKKAQHSVIIERTPAVASQPLPAYLFLVNGFFTKSKKFFFLRNSLLFNKSRYSRNRQTYRTGVLWCIWLTVLTVLGLYFYFYVFLIKFTFAWVFFFFFILSFFFSYFRSKVERHFFF